MCDMCKPRREITTLPMPTWHGFGDRPARQYEAFLHRRLLEEARAVPDQLRRRLTAIEQDVHERQSYLRRLQEEKIRIEAAMADVRVYVSHTPSDEEIARELEWMSSLPYVLGTRTDMQGRLFVQFRVTCVEGETTFDLGDYELGFVKRGGKRAGHLLHLVRTPPLITPYDLFSYEVTQYGPSFAGWISVPGYHIRTAHLVELLQRAREHIIERIQGRRGDLRGWAVEAPDQLEQVWEGGVSNLLKAYKRSVELLTDQSPREVLRELECSLRDQDQAIRFELGHIRKLQAEARSIRAEREKALEVLRQGVTIDPERVRGDLDYFASLPGVMGLRFDRSGIPVIHLRTTHVLDGVRYDLGDFEIFFTTSGRNESASVVKIRSTRRADDPHHYKHNGGTEQEWFCFGGRANTLQDHFDKGEYRQFLHLLINSMNGINAYSRNRYELDETYSRIAMDAVWQSRPRSRRPRRRPRATPGVVMQNT